jgi:CopG family nickel-responsive transcriptional regulator
MSELVRFTVSLEPELYKRLERILAASGYENRSEFIRDLVRERLVKEEWDSDKEVVGVITLIYDHSTRELNAKLTNLQHHHHDVILATTHVHLNHRLCAETTLARGQASEIRAIADSLRRQKGVLHATLSLSSTGKHLD